MVVGMARAGEVDENLAALAADVPGDLWFELVEAGLVPASAGAGGPRADVGKGRA